MQTSRSRNTATVTSNTGVVGDREFRCHHTACVFFCLFMFVCIIYLFIRALFIYLFIRALDLRTRTSRSTRFNLNFSRVFRKKNTPQKASFYFFHKRSYFGYLYWRRAKWWNFIHLITCSRSQQTTFAPKEWWRLSLFPTKMTLVHAWATLSIEEISYSYSSSSQNLKTLNSL